MQPLAIVLTPSEHKGFLQSCMCLSRCKAVRVHVAARGEDPGREQELEEGYANIKSREMLINCDG